MTAAACSAATAFPRKATEVTMIITTAMDRNVRTGSRRPSRKMITETIASATMPATRPTATHTPSP